ncbi:AsmA family protein [Roseateles sp.]|uniref:AsmA family protein n=1 Tax=Roseateles sp. TaxID=1971397 RepID=UPI0025DC9BBA|nr:AsmA family protein [Roseateles sp.]MBV8037168.1 AsmA family protein [Roseateles sp.]
MKVAAKTVGAVVLAVLAAGSAMEGAGWPGLAPWLAARAGHGLDMAGDSRLHLLLTPSLEAARLRVTGSQGEALADARGLQLNWQWRDLWAWRQGAPLRLRRVQADELLLNWQRDAAGRTAWPLQPGGERHEPTELPRIDHLVIRQGVAHLDDAPLQLQGDARFATQADGRWTATLQGRLRGQQLALRAEAGAGLALLAPAEAGLPPVQLSAELTQRNGRLSFAGSAASLLDARALDGQLQVRGDSLADIGRPFNLTLPNTPPLVLSGRLRHAAGVWQLDGARARIGRSQLGGDFAVDTRPSRPLLSGLLRGGPLRLADLGPAFGTDTPPSRPGRVLPDRPWDLPSLRMMDARVAVALSQLDLGSARLAPLAPVNASLVLEDGLLSLRGLSAGIAGGEASGSARLDTRPSPPQWRMALGVRGMAVEQWLRVQTRRLAPDPLSGRLRADMDVQGRGRSPAELLGSLDGPLHLQLDGGNLSRLLTEAAELDLAQGLGVLLRGDRKQPLNCARLDGGFRAGVLRPRSAVIDNRDSRIDIDGRISLADETLDLRVVARPKSFSPLTLRSPVRVQGRLGAPHVTLEGRALGGKAIAAVALGALAPPAALLAFVDPGENLPPVSCDAASAPAYPAARPEPAHPSRVAP